MSQQNTKIITGVAIVVAIIIVAGVIILSWQISGSGYIAVLGLDVYSDSSLTTTIKAIDWGKLYPGDTKGVNIWVKITGTENVKLTLSNANWNPSTASQYLTLGWNYTAGTILSPGTVKHYLLTLTCDPLITGITAFTFDIFLEATST